MRSDYVDESNIYDQYILLKPLQLLHQGWQRLWQQSNYFSEFLYIQKYFNIIHNEQKIMTDMASIQILILFSFMFTGILTRLETKRYE